jgi:5'-phosphate synthase pdxT subunit
MTSLVVGILALQGDFFEHEKILHELGVATQLIKQPADLKNIDGLIIPGGESTVMARLMDSYGLREPVTQKIAAGLPTWGTCAGLILLANSITEGQPEPLNILDITVKRNAFGRQVDSFSEQCETTVLRPSVFEAVYIRAPRITKVGKTVRVLAKRKTGEAIAVQQNAILGTSFHPELTQDARWHHYFLSLLKPLNKSARSRTIR